MRTEIKDLNEFLSKVKYKDFGNLSEYVYINYIKDLQNKEEIIDNLITFMLWNFKSDDSFNICELTSGTEYFKQVDKASGILSPNIDNLIEQDVEERNFYINIWETVSNPSLFAADDDIIGALIFLLCHDKVPYFKLDKPLNVTDEEFSNLFDTLNMKIQRFIYVFNRGYEYRTEVASQLLRIIESESDEKHRVVLLAYMLHYLRWTLTSDKNEGDSEEKTEEQSD